MKSLLLAVSFCLASALAVADTTPQPVPTPTKVTPFMVPGVTPEPNYPSGWWDAWQHITLQEAQRLHKQHGVVFADARGKAEWDQGHIPGAIPLPVGEFDKYYKQYESKLKHAKVIVCYCHGVACHLSDKDCNMLIQKGLKNVVGFFGGWPEWQQAKLPVEDKDGKMTYPAKDEKK